MDTVIALLLVAPALVMAMARSSSLLDYAIWLFALNRGIRRVVDYYINGEFNPFSPISLTPLIIGSLLLFAALSRIGALHGRPRIIVFLLTVALGIGFTVGLLVNGVPALYSLGEWTLSLGLMLFVASHPQAMNAGNRWMRTIGWAGVFVAAYGWWQYLTIPPWDAMWLEQAGMVGYMGTPEPTKMTCFSTLHERGPCCVFLGWAAVPMILNPRWRNRGGWFSLLLLLSVMLLTGARSMFIVVTLIVVLHPMLARGQGFGRTLLIAVLIAVAANFGLEKIPGAERFTERFSSESLAGEGSSLQGRVDIYEMGIAATLANPLGSGLGSSGMGRRASQKGIATVGDAGYIQIFAQFGWIGASLFFLALALLWMEASQRFEFIARWDTTKTIHPFLSAARAVLLAMLVFLFVSDVFAGFSFAWVFFGLVLNTSIDPARLKHLASLRKVMTPRTIELPVA